MVLSPTLRPEGGEQRPVLVAGQRESERATRLVSPNQLRVIRKAEVGPSVPPNEPPRRIHLLPVPRQRPALFDEARLGHARSDGLVRQRRQRLAVPHQEPIGQEQQLLWPHRDTPHLDIELEPGQGAHGAAGRRAPDERARSSSSPRAPSTSSGAKTTTSRCFTTAVRHSPNKLQSLESSLDPRQFARVHRSHLLNVSRVARIEPWG